MARKSIVALVVLVLSAVAVWAQTSTDPTAVTQAPEVISGAGVGLRVTGPLDRNGRLPARLVVKSNGQWVEVVSTPGVVGAGK
ncbi:MAG TPA: hypothetical protein VJ813_17055 [Vicinamibacterales bacterium]|nr:hypothetical protein [Vicinamibacterales bacterium]